MRGSGSSEINGMEWESLPQVEMMDIWVRGDSVCTIWMWFFLKWMWPKLPEFCRSSLFLGGFYPLFFSSHLLCILYHTQCIPNYIFLSSCHIFWCFVEIILVDRATFTSINSRNIPVRVQSSSLPAPRRIYVVD
jgi:hypothetical protein